MIHLVSSEECVYRCPKTRPGCMKSNANMSYKAKMYRVRGEQKLPALLARPRFGAKDEGARHDF